jgi:hypothetical protein
MTAAGWVFLGVSWGLIIGLCLFCCERMVEQHQRRKTR